MGVQGVAHLVQGPPEGRVGVVQAPAHTGPLGALPGEQEGGAAGHGPSAHDVVGGGTVGQCGESGQQFVPVTGDDRAAVGEVGAARGQ